MDLSQQPGSIVLLFLVFLFKRITISIHVLWRPTVLSHHQHSHESVPHLEAPLRRGAQDSDEDEQGNDPVVVNELPEWVHGLLSSSPALLLIYPPLLTSAITNGTVNTNGAALVVKICPTASA